IFIKDYQNVRDKKVREKHGLVASIGGVIVNIILFVVKFLIGVLVGSRAIISDAINNLTDLVSNIVSLFGFKIASRPADKKHPYGHERVEYITGMIVSFIIIAVAIVLGYTSIMALVSHDVNVTFTIASFIVLAVAIVGKILLGLFYNGMGKAIDSVSLKANMQDSINDAISTGAVLVSSLVIYFVPSLWWLDPAVSIAVAIFILYSGIKLVMETVSPLIGLTPDSDFVKEILKEVMSFKGVLGIHDLVVHSYGETKIFITLHVEVDAYVDVMESHDLIDNIESEIGKKFGVELTIHMDPVDTKNPEIVILKEEIAKALGKFNAGLTFHDLRIVKGVTHTNVLFDVVLPLECHLNQDEVV
ncbi:MAG: cation diffusion facilitator family transporter, partial [Bacteroidaceae bacterium]|nr:cation diffusion facilitator family transporter [Bacteroidaceae bacterium]